MTDDFSKLSPPDQKRELEKAKAEADWVAANGPMGGVIRHLRERAAATRRTSKIFLWMLVATVVIGLTFYLGLPFWQIWADGREEALNETLQDIRSRTLDLDADRKSLLAGGRLSDGTVAPDLSYLLEDTFSDLPIQTGAIINDAIEFDQNLYLVGEGGTLLRLASDESGFEKISTGESNSLYRAAIYNGKLFMVGGEGIVLRLDASSEKPDRLISNSTSTLTNIIVHNDRLYFLGDESALLRLSEDGESVERIEIAENFDVFSALSHDGRLYFFGSTGSAFQLRSDGTGVERIITKTNAQLSGSISYGKNLYFFGEAGTLLRLSEGGLETERIETGGDQHFTDAFEYDSRLYLVDLDGSLLGFSSNPMQLDRKVVGLRDAVSSVIYHAGREYFLNVSGSAFRLSEDGLEIRPLATSGINQEAMFVVFKDKLYIVGLFGVSVQSTSLAESARKLPFKPDTESLTIVDSFLDSMPPHISSYKPFLDYVSALNDVAAERIGLEVVAQQVDKDLSSLRSSPLQYLRNRKALDFDSFLKTCRSDTPTPELTTACLTAWQTEQAQSQRSWWEALTAQVPPGILLLFLLATLGGLYRYNLRLAGFYESRADFLTLMTYGRTEKELRDVLAKTQTDAVNLATLVLAADKVEMGAIKAKLGQAEIELARTLTGAVDAEEKKGS